MEPQREKPPGQEQEEEEEEPTQDDLPNERVTMRLRQLIRELWPEKSLPASSELSDHLQRASAKGDNYLGVVWRLRVPPDRSLVVKLPPQNSVRRKQFFARPCFLRESQAYEEFLPLVEELQERWGVPEEERFRQHARCFHTCRDEPDECIVLEDLCRSGFQLHDRFRHLPLQHVAQVMRAYGKLHAVSLAAKRQCPERLLPFRQMVDIFEQRRDDTALASYFENLKESALSALLSPADDAYGARLREYFSRGTYFDLLLPLINGTNCEPYAVVCHGDCWNNNIMYRLCPLDLRLIDWQLMRYASPVTDLAYFLFTCTTRAFRQRHLQAMLEEYHVQLGQQLTRLGESVEQLLPRKAFAEQLRAKAAVGLLLAMMVLPIVTMQGQDVPDLQAISDMIEAGGSTNLQGAGFLGTGNEELYKRRMREVILDCVDSDYI
ncbi:GL27004 [Drosophila persimilis]|uniref:GL27004 n=2 Tax=Drosophila persimilis TaxID=7234 RepID=B4H7D8_DROPE|nr:GL27004 [Drosophila persimilis]